MAAPTADDPYFASHAFEPTPSQARRARGRGGGRLVAGWLRRALRRQWLIIVFVALLVAALGLLYGFAAAPEAWPSVANVSLWAGIGLGVGLTLAGLRELNRNAVTALSSLGKHRGFAVLGAAPELEPKTLRLLPPDRRSPLGCVVFQPSSAFAGAFRDLQGAFAQGEVVAFIGSLPGEGASTTAFCTALAAAQQQRRVILLDCDLRHRGLSLMLEREVNVGLLDACAEPHRWREFTDEEEETGLHFIPMARSANPWRSLIDAAGFEALLQTLRQNYDLVVLDCSPALRSADGPVAARMADRCVIVAAWDETPIAALRGAMRMLRARATAVFVNRVPAGYRFGRLRPN